MKPVGPLMVEHRLIERMVKVLEGRLEGMKSGRVNRDLIAQGVDFFRMYADRTHHGKEENILFKALSAKQLSDEDKEMMDRLVQEHIWARQAVGRLSDANRRYIEGDREALKQMVYELDKLVKFYPMHIEKEDKHFFIPAMDYFSQEEQQRMLGEFWEFDRRMIHEKYKMVVEEIEKSLSV